MSESKQDHTIALNVRLKFSDSSAYPCAANYMNVGIAQGTAYLDFGSVEPALLAAIANTAKNGQAAPKRLGRASCYPRGDGGEFTRPVAAANTASAGRVARGATAESERF